MQLFFLLLFFIFSFIFSCLFSVICLLLQMQRVYRTPTGWKRAARSSTPAWRSTAIRCTRKTCPASPSSSCVCPRSAASASSAPASSSSPSCSPASAPRVSSTASCSTPIAISVPSGRKWKPRSFSAASRAPPGPKEPVGSAVWPI